MDIVRSWLAAIGGYLVGMWLAAWLGRIGGDQAAYGTFFGRVLWLYLPLIVVFALIGGAASAAHTRPRRWERVRHLVAVLPIPVVAILLSTVMSLAGGGTEIGGVLLSILAGALGTACGILLTDLVWLLLARERESYF